MIEGTQVGAYRIVRQIGEGGMGSVWLAEHMALGRRAALKVLHPEFSTRPDIVTRFFNEARAATAIADPGIVQIFDFGQHVDGSAYIVMELLDGEPLDHRLRREGALSLADGLRLMRQVASTLAAAHTRGIIHRDLKPENIFIVRDPEVPGGQRAKVLDFGIAKLVGDRAAVKTETSAVMGTPTFMSPEQCRGAGQVDQRSDVYALGCVLFTLITGRPPFNAEGIGDIIAMHLREPPPAPSQLRPGIPLELDQVVLCCLAKDPAQRFPSAGELAIAIGALLGSTPQLPAPPVQLGHPIRYVPTAPPTTLSAATGVTSHAPPQRSRTGVIAAIAGLGAVGIAIAAIASRGHEPSATAGRPAQAPIEPAGTPAAAAAPAVPPAPTSSPPPDTRARVAPILKEAMVRFGAWSRSHAGAPCPDAAALGTPADPWGHPLAITCSDQPGDQVAGAISAGPDGAAGTADDIASWQLGPDVTDVVRGARWPATPQPPSPPASQPPPAAAAAPANPPSVTAPAKAARPRKQEPSVQFDENGLPVTR